MTLEEEEVLCGWTIYYRPTGFPQHYVVSMWTATDEGGLIHQPIAVVCDTLDEARTQIPAGCVRFDRDPEDDATIVETWL